MSGDSSIGNGNHIIMQAIGRGDSAEPTIALHVGDSEALTLSPLQHAQFGGTNISRTEQQLVAMKQDVSDPLFGTSLQWPFRGYAVKGSGLESLRPKDFELRLQRVRSGRQQDPLKLKISHPDSAINLADVFRPSREQICLFNVIVALEWIPTSDDLDELELAFRGAAETLYDVTDGYMTIGQVVFAGPEMMDGADIQIMASNRFHPRSWANGLHEGKKYSPIRVGRGLWHKDEHRLVAWREPEGFRTLIHEWAHYALALKDSYLDTVPSPPTGEHTSEGQRLVVPTINPVSQSIMADVAHDELTADRFSSSKAHKQSEWSMLAQKKEFAFLRIPGQRRVDPGPTTLPLPFPQLQYMGVADLSVSEMIMTIPPDRVDTEHCWVYVIRGDLNAPTKLIAQGMLDAASVTDGFRLLGAQEGDHLLLIGRRPSKGAAAKGVPVVVHGTIRNWNDERQQHGSRVEVFWDGDAATPPAFPIIDVLPAVDATAAVLSQNSNDTRSDQRMIRVQFKTPGLAPEALFIFPINANQDPIKVDLADPAKPYPVSSLDGHVLALWNNGRAAVVSTYSLGGGPKTMTVNKPPPTTDQNPPSTTNIGGPDPVNPTTGGSADGNVMLFFGDQNAVQIGNGPDPSDLRIVTTMNDGVDVPTGLTPSSYTYSISSNQLIPRKIDPTLCIFFDDNVAKRGKVQLLRLDGTKWQQIVEAHIDYAISLAAIALNPKTAPSLVTETTNDHERVEHYRLVVVANGIVEARR